MFVIRLARYGPVGVESPMGTRSIPFDFFIAGKTMSAHKDTRDNFFPFGAREHARSSPRCPTRGGYSFRWDGYFLSLSREKMKTIIPIATRAKCTWWKFHLYRRTLRRMHCIRKRAGGCNFYTYSPEFGLEYRRLK